MKGKFLILTHLFFAILLPLTVGYLTPANDGLTYLFMLFMVINPLYSVFVGYRISKDFRGLWCHIPLLAVTFLVGFIVVFRDFDYFYLYCSFAYLIISAIVAWILSKRKQLNTATNS